MAESVKGSNGSWGPAGTQRRRWTWSAPGGRKGVRGGGPSEEGVGRVRGQEAPQVLRAAAVCWRGAEGPSARGRGQEPGLGKRSPRRETRAARAAEPSGPSVTPPGPEGGGRAGRSYCRAGGGGPLQAPEERASRVGAPASRSARTEGRGHRPAAPGGAEQAPRRSPASPGAPQCFPTCSSPGGFQTLGNNHRRRRPAAQQQAAALASLAGPASARFDWPSCLPAAPALAAASILSVETEGGSRRDPEVASGWVVVFVGCVRPVPRLSLEGEGASLPVGAAAAVPSLKSVSGGAVGAAMLAAGLPIVGGRRRDPGARRGGGGRRTGFPGSRARRRQAEARRKKRTSGLALWMTQGPGDRNLFKVVK